MGDGEDHRVEAAKRLQLRSLRPKHFDDMRLNGVRIMDDWLDPELAKLAANIDHAGIADVRDILLEGHAKDADARRRRLSACRGEQLHHLLRDERTHAAVDS